MCYLPSFYELLSRVHYYIIIAVVNGLYLMYFFFFSFFRSVALPVLSRRRAKSQ